MGDSGEMIRDSGTGGYFDDGALPGEAHQGHSKAIHHKAYGARGAVQRIHEEMTDVENVLTLLEKENEDMKIRLLKARQSVWQKYFMCDGHLMCQAVMGCWRHWTIVKKQQKEVDGISHRHTWSVKELKKRQEELEAECSQLRFAAEQLQEVTTRELQLVNADRDEAIVRAQQLEVMISQMGEVAGRVTSLSEQAMQRPIATPGILADIDRVELDKLVKSTLQDILVEADQAKIGGTATPFNSQSMYLAQAPSMGSTVTTIVPGPASFVASPPTINPGQARAFTFGQVGNGPSAVPSATGALIRSSSPQAGARSALQRSASPSLPRSSGPVKSNSAQSISFPGPMVGAQGGSMMLPPPSANQPLGQVVSVRTKVPPSAKSATALPSSGRSTGAVGSVIRSTSRGRRG